MIRGRRLIAIAILLSALAAFASAEAANGNAAPSARRVTEGTLLWRTGADAPLAPAPVLDTQVEMRVSGVIVRVTVRQEFTNPSTAWAEAIYVFPLPEDAAVDHLRMRVGDRLIEGVVEEREAAKASYEQAKREGRKASLIEEERANIFTTSVANIPPRAAITIEIEYQHVAAYDTGQFKLRFPMVVGPRYIPGSGPAAVPAGGSGWGADTDQVPDASRITPPVRHPSRGPINPVTLAIELDPGVPLERVESAYHAIRTTALGDGRHRVELEQGTVPADRDFELTWTPAPGAAPAAALLAERTGTDVFALLLVVPPTSAAPESVRGPREAVFVIDVSGSMNGASIKQARAALKLALARLAPGDTFNVIKFNHQTTSLFDAARPATPANLRTADAWVEGLTADGRTEMLPALRRALDGTGDRGPPPPGDLPHRRLGGERGGPVQDHHRAPRLEPAVHDRHRLGAEQPLHARGGAARPRHLHVHRQPHRGAGQDGARCSGSWSRPRSPTSGSSFPAGADGDPAGKIPDLYRRRAARRRAARPSAFRRAPSSAGRSVGAPWQAE